MSQFLAIIVFFFCRSYSKLISELSALCLLFSVIFFVKIFNIFSLHLSVILTRSYEIFTRYQQESCLTKVLCPV